MYPSIRSTIRSTIEKEGIRGLYRGFSTSCSLLIVQQLYILMYEKLRARDTFTISSGLSEPTRNGLSAAIAVTIVQVVANPIDVIVQRKMLQGQVRAVSTVSSATVGVVNPPVDTPQKVLSAREIALNVFKTKGLWGFFSGFAISCLQFVPSASLWWWSYPIYRDALLPSLDKLTKYTNNFLGKTEDINTESSASSEMYSPFVSRISEVLSGSLASATVAVSLNPVDIVRTRSQVNGESAISVFRNLVAMEGIAGLWKGVLPRMALLIPQGALSVTAYELVKRFAAKDVAISRFNMGNMD
jgi:Mitochondrial carrier protein